MDDFVEDFGDFLDKAIQVKFVSQEQGYST